MNKVAAAICILACGTALAEEKAKITPAQRLELGKKIASIDKKIEEASVKLKEAEAAGNKLESVRASQDIKRCQWLKDQIQADEKLHWKKIEKNKNDAGRYWKEPAEGEKEGKWVIWQDVAG